MSGPFSPMKNPAKVAAGSKGGKMRQAPNRETIQAQRKKHIMKLRLAGKSFAEIATKMGLDRATCWRLHDETVEDSLGETRGMARRMRHKLLLRLEMVEVRLLALLLDPRLKVRKTTAEGSVMELPDFEVLNKLNAALVKNYERQAKLAGADALVQVEQPDPREFLNRYTLAAMIKKEEKGANERDES